MNRKYLDQRCENKANRNGLVDRQINSTRYTQDVLFIFIIFALLLQRSHNTFIEICKLI